jgi:3-hydroxyacyl-CoA dehydrogenase
MIDRSNEVGVVGVSTMGAGVALTFAVAGYPAWLRDIGEPTLNRGMARSRRFSWAGRAR